MVPKLENRSAKVMLKTKTKPAPVASTAAAALEFVETLNQFTQHRRFDEVANRLQSLAPRMADPEFLATVGVLNRYHAGPAPLTPVRIKPPKWKGSKKTRGGPKRWSVDFHGMALQVVHTTNPVEGVVFEASIDGQVIAREKMLRVAQEKLDAEAIRRATG
jgi:hypothetical protein